MTKAERRLVRQWEETLIADYDDHRSRALLDPLYQKMLQWKSGELTHDDLFQSIHEMHKENRERYNFFCQRRPDLVRNIQFDPWFQAWLEQHPAPVGADVLPEEILAERWEEMAETPENDGEEAQE